MVIWLDGILFENTTRGGVWRYFYEVFGRIARRETVLLWLRAEPKLPLPPGVQVVRDSGRLYGARYDPIHRCRRWWARRRIPRPLRSADLFVSTGYTTSPIRSVPEVLVVFDMIPELNGHIWEGATHFSRPKERAIPAAARLICISHAGRADLERFFPDVADRIRVVHLGADHTTTATTDTGPNGLRGSNVLFVGKRGNYKNFWVLVEAIAHDNWPRGVRLNVVGPAFEPYEKKKLNALGVANRVSHLGWLSDDQLVTQYRTSAAFVYPSLCEGFGLPVLEAQVNGCPTVLSDIPVFREVAGDAAVFFRPHQPEHLVDAIRTVCEPQTSTRLIQAGYDNVRQYDWDRCADGVLAVYREVCGGAA